MPIKTSSLIDTANESEPGTELLVRLGQVAFTLGNTVEDLAHHHTNRLDHDVRFQQDAAEHLDELEYLVRLLRQVIYP